MSVFHRVSGVGLALLLWSAPAAARAPGGFGIGVIGGDPEALVSWAWRQGDEWYLQGSAGWDLRDDAVHITVDYVLQPKILDVPDAPGLRFPLYVGVGARLHVGDGWGDENEGLGVRVPFGMSMMPTDVPIDVFLEIAPAVIVFPQTEGELDGGIGIRFYF